MVFGYATLAAFALHGLIGFAELNPPVRTDANRNATALQVSLKKIGCLRPKSVREVGPSNFTIDGAPVDRDFVDFDKYRDYLEPLGVSKIRILAGWAKSEPKFRFYNLYGKVVETETLKCAWQKVKANEDTAGIDGVTMEDVGQSEGGAEAFIAGIQKELREKTYRASPVRRVYIEKANGKLRPLGIPTVKDRVVQSAVCLIVEPIFEADFHDCSYGFRPDRGAQQAVNREKSKLLDMEADKSALSLSAGIRRGSSRK